ncbi:hypothetical protein CHH28_19645 [Bacterioplanes sanyensis]|uniref:Uncharacterized protein n=1 Tax=Bacterioplanes sanyensis TaxID=1249553 RepID=A0A222FQF8_9GAMM|nr:hypothetical protein [Bacterioplanes sanyensis]ASP40746.1 hypothetical protein CHH28_19645 [Bacterioplanes sanyensis]
MNQPLRAEYAHQDDHISTIMSERVLVPITCQHCKMDTDVSVATLTQQHPFLCEHCYQINRLSSAELHVMVGVLERFGYHLKR